MWELFVITRRYVRKIYEIMHEINRKFTALKPREKQTAAQENSKEVSAQISMNIAIRRQAVRNVALSVFVRRYSLETQVTYAPDEHVDIDPMLVYCWANVADAGPTLNQHWVDVSCTAEQRAWTLQRHAKGRGWDCLNPCELHGIDWWISGSGSIRGPSPQSSKNGTLYGGGVSVDQNQAASHGNPSYSFAVFILPKVCFVHPS